MAGDSPGRAPMHVSNLTQNGNMEQTIPNPWTMDISAFYVLGNGTVYTPGQSYNSKLVMILAIIIMIV